MDGNAMEERPGSPKGGILVVGPIPPPYHGVTVSVELLLIALRGAGIPFHHCDISDRRDISSVDRLDWRNLTLGIRHLFGYLCWLPRRSIKAVYLPLCQTKLGFVRDLAFLLPARLFGKVRILHMHGSRFRKVYQSCGPILRWLVRAAIGGKSHILVLGDSLRGMFDGIADSGKIHTVPNGIDGDKVAAQAECRAASYSACKGDKQVLYFGSLTAAKGVHDALEAAAKVAHSHKDVKFTFAGGFRYPDDRTRAEEIVRDNGLEDRVTILGITTGAEKVRVFVESDVFLFPSHDEGQPLVLLEAMAAGLPIVTTSVGAIAETVANGENGFVVRPREPELLAQALEKLLSDGELRRKMSKNNLLRYRQVYTMASLSRRLSEVIQRAML